MGIVSDRKRRTKQINVRLNKSNFEQFNYIKTKMLHQTVSDSVRDLIRSGYLNFRTLCQSDIDNIMMNLPNKNEDEVKEFQLNVRLNDEEMRMADELIKKMRCGNISAAIRNLISIYHFSMTEG